jgi:acetyl esterase
MAGHLVPDKKIFLDEFIDPETKALNARIQEMLSALPRTYTLLPQTIRDAREQGGGLWITNRLEEVKDRSIPGPNGEIPLRVYVPEKIDAVYLHIHGGGFMLGRAHHSDEPCFRIANACNVATVSVDYRLAPEHPFPAGLDDCQAAALWVIHHLKEEFGTDRLIIGGESAGANLSVATLLRLRDRQGFTGFSGACLTYGVYDLSGTPSSLNWGEERVLILTSRTMEWFNENYAPRELWKNPEVSPLYADLQKMPKALFSVGTLDPLLDDSLFMAGRWTAAGNEAELAVYPGGIHAFNAFPIPLADKANNRIIEFIKQSAMAAKGD